jgi:hypothetical protein
MYSLQSTQKPIRILDSKSHKSFRLYNTTLLKPFTNTIPNHWRSPVLCVGPVFQKWIQATYIHFFFKSLPLNYAFLQAPQKIYNYVLLLNFKRLRFFPNLRTRQNEILTSLSLGLFAKYFNKGKFFLKSKIVYLVVSLFLRKIMLFANFRKLILIINRKPKYFHEILNALSETSIAIYKNPFDNSWTNEAKLFNPFQFPYILFTNNKPYGAMKLKQRGRLKRKINRKIILINKILD